MFHSKFGLCLVRESVAMAVVLRGDGGGELLGEDVFACMMIIFEDLGLCKSERHTIMILFEAPCHCVRAQLNSLHIRT
jgi:hypothetical protein